MPLDFIDSYLEWTNGVPAPYIFRLWSAIAAVAGAAERRVWVRAYQRRPTYLNLFTLLVASPGIGKGIIDETELLWRKAKKLHVAPDSINAATLLEQLAKSKRVVLRNGVVAYEYHSLLVPAEEFGVLVPTHENQFLSYFNRIFPNPDEFSAARVYFKGEILSIYRPQLNILAGTQPLFLGSLLPEAAWGMGFTQRLLLIYSGTGRKVKLFQEDQDYPARDKAMETMIVELANAEGELSWSPEASRAISAWDELGGPPAPTHSRLVHYVNRRTQFMLKLMGISCLSRREGFLIIQFDFDRALTWLLAAEAVMPDVFREMMQKSDRHIIQELFRHAFEVWTKNGQKPIHEARLLKFLTNYGPGEKVLRILELAERCQVLERTGVKYYIPKSLNEAELL